jgi:hypothetical protein
MYKRMARMRPYPCVSCQMQWRLPHHSLHTAPIAQPNRGHKCTCDNSSVAECIYCRATTAVARFTRPEHVIPKAFGRFEHNLTIFCVNLEVSFNRNSGEALMRLLSGVKPPAEAHKAGSCFEESALRHLRCDVKLHFATSRQATFTARRGADSFSVDEVRTRGGGGAGGTAGSRVTPTPHPKP